MTEHQPREHSVLCRVCFKRPTWNQSAVCDDCRCPVCHLLLVDDACPDASCETNYRRPTSLDRFGRRNW